MTSKAATIVHNTLLQHTDADGQTDLTDTDLAILTGYGRRTIQYSVRELKDRDLVTSALRGDHGTKRTLTIHPAP